MAVSYVHQREIVEVSFRFLDGIERIHPALVISVDELQEAEEGIQREASVVRSTVVGNAKASESGTGNKVRPCAFLIL